MLKRMVSFFLTLAMVITMLPVPAIALETETEPAELILETEPVEEETKPEVEETVAENELVAHPVEGEEYNSGEAEAAMEETESSAEETEPAAETTEPVEEEPSAPAEAETEAATEETEPAAEVTEPSVEVTEPSVEVTEPATEETVPATEEPVLEKLETDPMLEAADNSCGENLTWVFDADSNTLTISGTGAMTDYSAENPAPWAGLANSIYYLVIESGVTTIGSYAFVDMVEMDLQGSLPDSLTKIGEAAFLGSGAYQITIPASVTEIGKDAFVDCSSLSEITFQGDLPTLPDTLFPDGRHSITVYYPMGNATWTEEARTNYGGNVVWFPYNENGDDYSCGENLTWKIEDTGIVISGTGAMTDYSAENPAPWNGYAEALQSITVESGVTTIGSYAFAGSAKVFTVDLPDTIVKIGSSAFVNCDILEQITFTGDPPELPNVLFSEGMKVALCYPYGNAAWASAEKKDYGAGISWYACNEYGEVIGTCGDLSWVYNIGGNDLLISGSGPMPDYSLNNPAPWSAFAENIYSIYVESGVTTVGDYAFANMVNLGYASKGSSTCRVELPDTVTVIGEGAFYGAVNSFKTMIIPAGVTQICRDAFDGCTALTNVTFLGDVPQLEDGLFDGKTLTVRHVYSNASWTDAAKNSFAGTITWALCDEYGSSLNLNGTCGGAAQWSIDPDTATLTISGTGAMTDINPPRGNGTPPWGAWREYIEKAVIESGIIHVGSRNFIDSPNLMSVTIPDTVQSIGVAAFADCPNLNLIIPASVTSISSSAVQNVGRLTVSAENAHYVSYRGSLLLNKAETVLVSYAMDNSSYGIPDTVIVIAAGAFDYHPNLSEITIPRNVKTIETYAFSGCEALKNVTFMGNPPETIAEDAFSDVIATAYYPAGHPDWTDAVKQNYGGTLTWTASEDIPGGVCGENLTWVYDKDEYILAISGTGAMTDYTAENPAPWSEYAAEIREIAVDSGVTSIGSYAFTGMVELHSLSLPDTLVGIGEGAFASCGFATSQNKITIPASVTQINKDAFTGCTGLTSIAFQGDLPALADTLFSEDMSLVAYYPSDNATWTDAAKKNYGGNIAWYGVDESGNAVGTCGDALTWSYASTSKRLTVSGTGAMADYSPENPAPWSSLASELRYLTIESGVTTIGSYAFAGMEQLGYVSRGSSPTGVTLPASLTKIGENAFTGCPELAKLIFLGDLPVLADTAFSADMSVTAYYPYGNATWTEEGRKEYDGAVVWYPCDEYGTAMGGSCGETVGWVFDPETATLTFTGSGEMDNVGEKDGTSPWNAWKPGIENVVIESGIINIGASAFSGISSLKNVTIPGTVEAIGDSVFANCTGLTELKLPASVTTLGDYAFVECTNLALTLGAGVSDVGDWAVRDIKSIAVDEANENFAAENGLLLTKDKTTVVCCAAVQTIYVIPDTVTTIGKQAFCDNNTLTGIVIPEGVKTIGESAFSGCLNLQTVDLPASLTTLEMSALCYTGLKEITIPAAVEFMDYGVLKDNEYLESVTFAGKVTTISNDQFYLCENLKSIRFKGDAPETIQPSAFYGVTATVYYPGDNATWTEEKTQQYAGTITWEVWEAPTSGTSGDNLTWEFDDWDGILTISGTGAMKNYSASNSAPWSEFADYLYEIIIESGVTTIGNYAFAGLPWVWDLQCPDTLTAIGESAFRGYGDEFAEFTVPAGVTKIGKNAFADNPDLTKIIFQGDLPALADTLFSEDMTLVAAYPQSNTTWTEAALKNYGGTVAWYPIAEDGSLMGTCGDDLTWTFNNYMLTISGSGAMADYSLENPAPWTALAGEVRDLTIESGVTSIGSYAFADMQEIGMYGNSDISVPDTVTKIGEGAFSGCSNLYRIDFQGDLPTFADTIFSEGMMVLCYYPANNATWSDEAKKNYGGTVRWYRFDENGIDLEGDCGDEAQWCIDPASGTLTITGTGEMLGVGGHSSGSWGEWNGKIQKVVLETGITRIGDGALSDLPALKEVIMPDTLVEIGYGAFQNCENLETAQLPNSVTTIGYYAFNGCSNLALTIPAGVSSLKYSSVQGVKAFSVDAANAAYTAEGGMLLNKDKTTLIAYAVPKTTYTIPATVTAIGEYAFYRCTTLTEMTIPETVKTIATYAFAECPNLTTVNLPQGIVLLEHRVFAESGLTEIIIPDSVEEIDIRVFESCEKLEKVVFAGEPKVHTIDYCAFDGCISLKAVELPDSVTRLGEYVFENTALTKIRIPAAMQSIGGEAFGSCYDLETVVFEGKLNELGGGVFYGCDNLKSIRFMGDTPDYIDDYAFDGLYDTVVYYPGENETWTEDKLLDYCGYVIWTPWETGTRGTCGDGLTWQYDEWDGILTISGTGSMTDYSDGTAPWANCNVKSIVLAEGVTTIGSYAFVDTGVSQIQLPEGLVSIGEYALPRELTSLDIPASLTSVYFENLTQLEQFNVAAGNTVFADVDGVLFSKDMTRLIRMPECWVKEWDKQSFIAYTVPDTVVELGEGSFEGCSFLKNIVLPDALQIIGERAIACYDADVPKGPETIILPVAVNAIGTDALTSAKLVVFTGDAPTMAETVFSTCAKTAYYPANNATWTQEKLLDYGGDLTWIPYETEMPTSGELSDTISWNFDEETATLTIDGTGVMAGYDYTYLHSSFITPWLHLTDKVQHVVIEEGITEIGNRIFKNHQVLETVTLPESLQVICDSAFYNNPKLKTVTMPEGVLTIEQGAFNGCSALESIRIPDTVTTIGDYAFSNCSNLKTVELSENLQQIGNCAFAGCAALTELLIPASVTTIGACAFEACTSLRMITFTGDAPAMLGAVFTDVIASVTYPAENTTWTEDVLQQYGGIITWIPVTSVANRIVMKNADLDGAASVWIDGKEYAVTAVNGSCYVDLPDGNAKTLVTYAYHAADSGDPHTQYPVSMKVWTLENTDGFYQVTRQAELDDILRYEGSSIRVTGTQGVRMITSVDQNDKAALTGEGLAGYTLKEYGTVIAWASRIRKSTPLVLNQSYVSSNHAYSKAEGKDPIFAYQNGRMQYTNVVVGYTMDQCKNDIAMRPYMILEDASGNEITLYGGIVNRSIGYIAYQNRNTFDANTEAYAYIWKIIHHVYGDAYDAEYKG